MANARLSIATPGAEAIQLKGWLGAHKWLILRRISQFAILLLFLLGPWFDLWLVKGNLASSLTLDVLPLTDPYVLLQTLVAGMLPISTAFLGAAIVLGFYLIVGGRSYCSWVCPVNLVTDLASWARRKLNIKGSGVAIDKNTRYWMLGATLIVAMLSGSLAWELINPVSMMHRGIIFGMGFAWAVILAVFIFDLFVSKHGWCGRLCPVGAFYSLPGKLSVVRVTADKRAQCDDCMDCFVVCPEPQVIRPALKGEAKGIGPVIMAEHCTNCGRCIDVCAEDVFHYATRFANRAPRNAPKPTPPVVG